MHINSIIDATNLKPNASSKDIHILCEQAMEHQFAAVCVAPTHALTVSRLIADSNVKSCSVVGFPYGYSFLDTKLIETEKLIDIGIQEIDFVINLAYIADMNFDAIFNETKTLVSICRTKQIVSKWIIECEYTRPFFDKIVEMANQLNPDFVKTSSGLLGGAKVDDIVILRQGLNSSIKLKASGGIQSKNYAIDLIKAGADRIGTSNPLFL